MLNFSCMGELRYFFLISSGIVHLFIVLRGLYEASLCIVLCTSPTPIRLFTVTEVPIWGWSPLRTLFPLLSSRLMGTQTLLVPRQFLSSTVSDFASSPVTLLWAAASAGWNRSGLPVWCLAAWPAFLAKWYWVNWRRKTCSGDLILQRG